MRALINTAKFYFQLVLVPCLWIILTCNAHADGHPLWGDLPTGDYKVGFRSVWEFDYSRAYDTTFNDKTSYAKSKTPRPILINMWYPTKDRRAGKAMRHRDYLDLPKSNPQINKLSAALAGYNREVIAQEVVDKPLEQLTALEAQLLDQFLNTPTACWRDARPAAGRFPLVIYHSGYGSSFEDNAVLCEFLASHGYIVLGSAFQEPTGESFNVDGKTTSVRDMEFLISYARKLPNVDWQHIGVVGHSGGAHAVLRLRAQERSVVDAVVSLDTTQDYYSLKDPRWNALTSTVSEGRRHFTGPLLAVANPYAFFPLFDTLEQSRRYYLTVRDLEHNDFIFQGGARQNLLVQLLNRTNTKAGMRDPNEEEVKERKRLYAIRNSYESLNKYVLQFLNAYLKGDGAARDGLVSQYAKTDLGGSELHVEYVPEGTAGPSSYQDDATGLPTPRQIRPFLRENGVEKTLKLLKRVSKESPKHPVLHQTFAFALIYDLLEEEKNSDAIAITAFIKDIHPGFTDTEFTQTCKDFASDDDDFAIKCFQKALILDPGNKEAARKLRELENKRAKSPTSP